MAQSVRDLLVWQRAIALAVCIHELTRAFPRDEMYGLTAQIRRTSISVASNIAEGRSRNNPADFRHFLGLAQSSVFELKTQLLVAGQFGMGESTALSFACSLCDDVAAGLAAFLQTLSSPPQPLSAAATARNGNVPMVAAQA